MKTVMGIVAVVLAVGTAFGDAASARRKFEQENAEAFARSFALPFEIAPEKARFDKPAGAGKYKIVLPYRDDARVRFVDATFADGKLASAKLKTFGWAPEDLTAAAFEKLREDFPMVAMRLGTDDVNPVAVLYPAKSRPYAHKPADDLMLSENPVAYFLGPLNAGGLGVTLGKLAYRVELRHPDGSVADLGICTQKSTLGEKGLFKALRPFLEKKWNRPGQVSDRDMVDFRHDSLIAYVPVEAPAPGKKGK